jgi:hypothetical protein
VRKAGVMVESGEARSEGDSGDVILNEPVDVDDSGGVAELVSLPLHFVYEMEKFSLICFLGYGLIRVIGFELSMVMEMLKKLVIKYLL